MDNRKLRKKVNINKLDFPVKQYIAARSVKDGFDSMKKKLKQDLRVF